NSICASSAPPGSWRTPRGCDRCAAILLASRPSPGRSWRASRAAPRRREGRSNRMPKRTLQGVVVSDKQDKTVVVRVERRFTHPIMKKTVRRTKKYYAHDETNEYHVDDIVWIEERRPLSKLKRWEVVRGEKKKAV